jgi:hypothetical protein
MSNINELIEQSNKYLDMIPEHLRGDNENDLVSLLARSVTALQEMQFQIASLETVVNVKKQRLDAALLEAFQDAKAGRREMTRKYDDWLKMLLARKARAG